MQLRNTINLFEQEIPYLSSYSREVDAVQIIEDYYTYKPFMRRYKISYSPRDIYHTVNAGEEGKLDIISYKYYKTTKLWWVIALANNITNPLRIKAGDKLRIPATLSIK